MSTPAIRAIAVPSSGLRQPCRCLWRGFSQMTMTRPWRRITLHFSHILLTLGRTFIGLSPGSLSLVSIGDPTSTEVVRSQLDLDLVTGKDPDVVHAHLSGDVGQHLVAVVELHPEHGVREGLYDRALQHDRVFPRFRQSRLLRRLLFVNFSRVVGGLRWREVNSASTAT